MNKKAHYAFLIIFTLCIFCPSTFVFADTMVTATYSATSGFDASTGTPRAFTNTGTKSDIAKIAAADNKRMQSDAPSWPTGDVVEPDKYIEFIFSPNIPSNATIQSVQITHEFRRSGRLDGAKLSVWDGAQFTDFPLTLGAQNVDHTDTFDITNLTNTPEKLNQSKARFLAYRGDGKTKTSHDYIGLSVVYTIPDIADTPPDPGGNDDIANRPVVQEQTLQTRVDTPLSISLVGIDPHGDPLTYTAASNPQKGTLSEFSENTIVYTPSGALGEDSFTVTANDGTYTSTPATVHITNTVGVLHNISIDVSNTAPTTGDSISVAIYGEDVFGNVVQDSIQSSATGDAVLDAMLGTLSKLTPGTTTISATNGSMSATPVVIIFSDPVVVSTTPPNDPIVVVHSGGGHPPIENTNPIIVPPAPILDTPETLIAETVRVEVPKVSVVQKQHTPKKAVAGDITKAPAEPVLLAASSESAFPIQKKIGIYAFIVALFIALCWRIAKKARYGSIRDVD